MVIFAALGDGPPPLWYVLLFVGLILASIALTVLAVYLGLRLLGWLFQEWDKSALAKEEQRIRYRVAQDLYYQELLAEESRKRSHPS